MRFTVTLDPDVALDLKKLMAAERLTFKGAVNQTMLWGFTRWSNSKRTTRRGRRREA
jgi:hypothetical protein